MAVTVGRFSAQPAQPLAAGFILAGAASLALVLAVRRSRAGDI